MILNFRKSPYEIITRKIPLAHLLRVIRLDPW
jgi:hypothetical protein